VNLKIFKFIRLLKKLPIYFRSFLSMIKSSIHTNDLIYFQACNLDESREFGSSSWLLHVFHVTMLWNSRVLVNYSNLPRSGIYLPFGNHGLFPFIIVGINHHNTNFTQKTRSTALSFHLSMTQNSQVAK